MENLSFLFIWLLLLCKYSYCNDSITSSQSLTNGTTLVSRNGIFELGLFSPGYSNNHYLGIWYRNIPVKTVVWVANRRNPINDSSGFLTIDSTGNLVLVNGKSTALWSTNSTKQARTPIVQLLDSGNLVLRDEKDGNAENFLWQSFDYPSDTLLPGMKLGMDLKKGLDRRVTAWKNWDDPSPGDFSWQVQLHNNPEVVVWKGSRIYCRSGPWNGITFSGTPQLRANPFFNFEFIRNKEEVYYAYHQKDSSEISRLVMNQTNNRRERFTWNNQNQSWLLYTSWPIDHCDQYGLCGAYGNCIITESPVCQCLKGFKPKSPEKWNSADWSEGCVRNKSLDCQIGDGFKKFTGLKLPDTSYSWIDETMDLEECSVKCSENCSCTAYANLDVRGSGSGCAIWFNDLIDIRQMPSGGQDLYIRMSASELGDATAPDKKIIVIIVTVIAGVSSALSATLYFCKIRRRFKDKEDKTNEHDNSNNSVSEQDLDLPLFDLITITNATDNFVVFNKIGEGGFGLVYKGKLADGQEIAVKRLSKNLGQGIEEFKNEVILISNLQHRNLVKLLGCCIQGEEKMLIYEYMPNKSLDFFIFDSTKAKLLDWCKRFNIIEGIARGLLYLHQDSRLRIIHRDLKASNVLLDSEMNPKISDFGIAKTFGGDQTEGNTNRVMGTFGYMAPEYATDGLFSVKSDVFSFGILILEIICGKRSRGFYHPDDCLNLVGYAWRLWKEGKSLELIDTILRESCDEPQVTRCIHISLLCVQQNPEDRPSIATVVLMLGSEIPLPNPKEPGFFKDKGPFESGSPLDLSHIYSFSSNETTATLLVAR